MKAPDRGWAFAVMPALLYSTPFRPSAGLSQSARETAPWGQGGRGVSYPCQPSQLAMPNRLNLHRRGLQDWERVRWERARSKRCGSCPDSTGRPNMIGWAGWCLKSSPVQGRHDWTAAHALPHDLWNALAHGRTPTGHKRHHHQSISESFRGCSLVACTDVGTLIKHLRCMQYLPTLAHTAVVSHLPRLFLSFPFFFPSLPPSPFSYHNLVVISAQWDDTLSQAGPTSRSRMHLP